MDVGDTSFVGNSGANNLHHINDVSESKNASSKTCDRYSRTVQFQQKFVSFLRRNTVIQKPGNSSFLSRETRGECKKHISLLGVNCRIVHLLLQKLSFSENLRKHIHTITAITNFLKTALFPPHASQLYECQVYISHTNYDTAWGLKVEITSSWSPFSSLIQTSPTHALWTIDFQSPPNSFYILSWGEFLPWVSIHHSTFYPLPPSACVPPPTISSVPPSLPRPWLRWRPPARASTPRWRRRGSSSRTTSQCPRCQWSRSAGTCLCNSSRYGSHIPAGILFRSSAHFSFSIGFFSR